MMALNAYFDESFGHTDGQPICVAGYFFKPNKYQQFARRWKVALKGRGVDLLHTTELVSGNGRFRNVSIEKRGELLSSLVDIVCTHALGGVAVIFHQKEFAEICPDWPQYFGSVYTAGCQFCLRMTVAWMDKHKRQERINYFFEAGPRFQAEANDLLQALGANATLAAHYRYGSHSIVPKQGASGLQTADLLAWSCIRTFTMPLHGRKQEVFGPSILRLARGPDVITKEFAGAKLRDFVQDELERAGEFAADVGPHKRRFQ